MCIGIVKIGCWERRGRLFIKKVVSELTSIYKVACSLRANSRCSRDGNMLPGNFFANSVGNLDLLLIFRNVSLDMLPTGNLQYFFTPPFIFIIY